MSISELCGKNECFETIVGKPSKKKRVNETIRQFYGVIQSATFFMKKNHFFFIFIFFVTGYAAILEKMSKKAVMLVFLGTKRSWDFFLVFWKKSKKSEKMRFFWKKAYGLRTILSQTRITIYHIKKWKIKVKKNVKKKWFSFFETFF